MNITIRALLKEYQADKISLNTFRSCVETLLWVIETGGNAEEEVDSGYRLLRLFAEHDHGDWTQGELEGKIRDMVQELDTALERSVQ